MTPPSEGRIEGEDIQWWHDKALEWNNYCTQAWRERDLANARAEAAERERDEAKRQRNDHDRHRKDSDAALRDAQGEIERLKKQISHLIHDEE